MIDHNTVTLATLIARIHHVRGALAQHLRLHYTTNVKTVHVIDNYGGTVEVFGDPENGAYEWLIRAEDGTIKVHSDSGYGSAGAAAREGLLVCEYGEW